MHAATNRKSRQPQGSPATAEASAAARRDPAARRDARPTRRDARRARGNLAGSAPPRHRAGRGERRVDPHDPRARRIPLCRARPAQHRRARGGHGPRAARRLDRLHAARPDALARPETGEGLRCGLHRRQRGPMNSAGYGPRVKPTCQSCSSISAAEYVSAPRSPTSTS